MQRKVLMTKEKGCVWTWLMENGEAAEIHCSRQDEHSGPVLGLSLIHICCAVYVLRSWTEKIRAT